MSLEERTQALSGYVARVKAQLEPLPNTQITTIRKQSRVLGYEAVNMFIYGLLNHKIFGALPIKIQFRFKTALYQESAMYYTYKRYGRWEMTSPGSTWVRMAGYGR